MSTESRIIGESILPPPSSVTGIGGWFRANLVNSWFNIGLTIVFGFILVVSLWYGLKWVFFDADWRVIGTLGGRIIIGQYNVEAACPGRDCFWRPQAGLILVTILLGMAWSVSGGGLTKRIAILVASAAVAASVLPYGFDKMGLDVRILFVANVPGLALGWAIGRYTRLGTVSWIVVFAICAFVLTLILLKGIPGVPFLQPVSVLYWGGLTLNLLLAVVGIGLSLPIGIALALGRRSSLKVVNLVCVTFIETFRGVPLITLLFMSQVLVPLAFPENFPQNSLVRAAIVITLFSSAYMAENVRGGLQSLHPGQSEAARALGLPVWQTTLFISLPQALRNVIPAIVGQFISLFKDTSLVYIIGMLDVVEISRAFIQGNPEYLASAKEVFVFLAAVFWVFTFTMSHVSRRVEQHLGVGKR